MRWQVPNLLLIIDCRAVRGMFLPVRVDIDDIGSVFVGPKSNLKGSSAGSE